MKKNIYISWEQCAKYKHNNKKSNNFLILTLDNLLISLSINNFVSVHLITSDPT
jgi:hypothetical protein